MATGPRFPKKTTTERDKPKTEAEVIARSAEVQAGGRKKTGRKPGKEPTMNITVSLPLTLIDALDDIAEERTGGNRSFALKGVLRGKYELIEEKSE